MWKSLFRNASKFDSWRAALFNIVGVHGKLDCLTPDAASLFTTLWDCLVSSRDGWRDWDKKIKVRAILLHCQTAAVGHYLTHALLLVLYSFLRLFFYYNLFISYLHGSYFCCKIKGGKVLNLLSAIWSMKSGGKNILCALLIPSVNIWFSVLYFGRHEQIAFCKNTSAFFR